MPPTSSAVQFNRLGAVACLQDRAVSSGRYLGRVRPTRPSMMLGISRPTLVRLLEDGEISYEQRGRHRRIMLADLLAYQASMRRERREALDRMAQEGQAAGLYDATVGPSPRTRLPSPMAMFPAFLDTCAIYGALPVRLAATACRSRYLPASMYGQPASWTNSKAYWWPAGWQRTPARSPSRRLQPGRLTGGSRAAPALRLPLATHCGIRSSSAPAIRQSSATTCPSAS